MANAMVIKVQYKDMLRRFCAKVDENNELVLDMDGLRDKIFSFFGFSSDADITLTYIDEDGDKVTLVDDDDLREVMNQELDFVTIEVVLNSDKVDNFPIRSSGRRTPLRSPRGPTLPEVLKSISEPPLLEDLFKLAAEIVSTSTSSNGSIVELFGFASEMLKNPGSRSQSRDSGASEGSNASKDESKPEESPKDATTTSKVSNASVDENMPEDLPKDATTSKGSNASKHGSSQKQVPKLTTRSKNKKEVVGLGDSFGGRGTTVTSVTTAPVRLNYNAAGGSRPPIVSPVGAPPPTTPPTYKRSPPFVSTFSAPPPPQPPSAVKIQNNNPSVYYSFPAFVDAAIPASSFSSTPAVSSSSSAKSSILPPPYPRPRPRSDAFTSHYSVPPSSYHATPFRVYSRTSTPPNDSYAFLHDFDPNGASSSHDYIPPKEGQ